MKPLTIEELKALPVGEWVWIVDIESPKGSGYWQIHGFAETHIHLNQEAARLIVPKVLYGKEWIAYKNKEQAEQCKNTCVLDNEQEHERLEKAEEMAEKSLCEVKCLCPSIKEAGTCCQCEVFTSLRDYYFEELEGEK